jgi:hypothetical protein
MKQDFMVEDLARYHKDQVERRRRSLLKKGFQFPAGFYDRVCEELLKNTVTQQEGSITHYMAPSNQLTHDICYLGIENKDHLDEHTLLRLRDSHCQTLATNTFDTEFLRIARWMLAIDDPSAFSARLRQLMEINKEAELERNERLHLMAKIISEITTIAETIRQLSITKRMQAEHFLDTHESAYEAVVRAIG